MDTIEDRLMDIVCEELQRFNLFRRADSRKSLREACGPIMKKELDAWCAACMREAVKAAQEAEESEREAQ